MLTISMRTIRPAFLPLFAAILVQASVFAQASGQPAMEEPVARVVFGNRTPDDLITYYEVITQLALMPDKPMEPASPADLQIALQYVINQRIVENQAVSEAEAFEWVPDNRGIQKKLQELTS
ncbi:MAG: hypothetical protein ABIU09_03240, partial [Pyrinomonadaceae bacterium]